jgi:hypothetical protein
MTIDELVDQCLLESGARGISSRAREVALVGFVVAPTGAISLREYRRRMKKAFVAANPNCGSVFLIIVLPILISVISAWITRWIMNRTEMNGVRGEAYDALLACSPGWKDTLTSISMPRKTPDAPEKW